MEQSNNNQKEFSEYDEFDRMIIERARTQDQALKDEDALTCIKRHLKKED